MCFINIIYRKGVERCKVCNEHNVVIVGGTYGVHALGGRGVIGYSC